MSRCPVCGGDVNADRSEAKRLLVNIGIVGEMCDPGGRVLTFTDGTTLRLSENCNACDVKKIFEFAQSQAIDFKRKPGHD